MNIKELRAIIKNNNLNVTVKARTNGCISAIAFDVDDLDTLNELLVGFNLEIKNEFQGFKINPRYRLQKVGLHK